MREVPPMQDLSAKRKRVVEAIMRHQRQGDFPLVRELAQELGLKGESSLTEMLDALTVDGWLQKQGGGRERQQRIYRLTEKALAFLATKEEENYSSNLRLPILSAITAGLLEEVAPHAGEFFDVVQTMGAKKGDVLLPIKGDSMVGDGIFHGDLALIRPNIVVEAGQIAAVQIDQRDGTWKSTLKRIYLFDDMKRVRLAASNPAYPNIDLPSNEVCMVGVYKGLIRIAK